MYLSNAENQDIRTHFQGHYRKFSSSVFLLVYLPWRNIFLNCLSSFVPLALLHIVITVFAFFCPMICILLPRRAPIAVAAVTEEALARPSSQTASLRSVVAESHRMMIASAFGLWGSGVGCTPSLESVVASWRRWDGGRMCLILRHYCCYWFN